MLWWWVGLAFGAGLAGVEVSDPSGCVDGNRVDDELRLALGDALVDRLAIRVSTSEPLVVRTVVREGDRTLWSRSTSFEPADCPAIPEAIALSVQQGLAALPGWSPDIERTRRRLAPTAHLVVSGALPPDGRFGAHFGARTRVAGPLGAWVQARLQIGPSVEVGAGSATLLHPALTAGLSLRADTRWTPDVWVLGGIGPIVAFGNRFDTDRVVVRPRSTVEVGAGVHPGGPVHIGLFTEIPVLRIQLLDSTGGVYTESLVRTGLVVGVEL
ncbi:MAG: hypothetical protein R3F61_32675 [Myxococcota bacterium]